MKTEYMISYFLEGELQRCDVVESIAPHAPTIEGWLEKDPIKGGHSREVEIMKQSHKFEG